MKPVKFAQYVMIILVLMGGISLNSALGNNIRDAHGAYFDFKNWDILIDGSTATISERHRITVLNPLGSNYTQFIAFENRYLKLKRIKLMVIDSSGTAIQSFDKRDFSKTSGFGAGPEVFSDISTYYKKVSFSKYPFSIIYELDYNLKSLFFWRGVAFQDEIPVKKATYSIRCPRDFEFSYRFNNPALEPQVEIIGSREHYIWELENIDALQKVEHAPDGYPEKASLELRAHKVILDEYRFDGTTWRDVGAFFALLAKDTYLPFDDGLELKSVDRNPEAIAESLYYEIVEKYRYVAVSMGISGWRPYSASLTAAKLYGDCKALAVLLISLLRRYNIPAYPVLLLTKGDGKLDEEFPSFGFNHVIVAVVLQDDTLWLDPTCNSCPFGELPAADENVFAVVVTDSGGIATRVPSSRAEDNSLIQETTVFLNVWQKIAFSSSLSFSGNAALRIKNRLPTMSKEQISDFVTELIPGGRKKYSIRDYSFENLNGPVMPIRLRLEGNRFQPLEEVEDVIHLEPFLFEDVDLFDRMNMDNRNIPLDIGYPRSKTHELTFTWDPLLEFDSIIVPNDDSTSCDLATLLCRFRLKSDTLRVTYYRSYNDYEIPVSNFDQYYEFRTRTKEILKSTVRFFKKKR